MNARLFTAATVVAFSCAALPVRAADQIMLNLVMPDAKVIAGVNVDQARISPFGQSILSQIAPQDQDIQKLTAMIGFDPRYAVHELLVASGAQPDQKSVLAMARGDFNPSAIMALAAQHGAKTEAYGNLTIIEDPQGQNGIAFATSALAIMGDTANVKAAIDRLAKPSILPADVMIQVNTWSGSEDAWVIMTVPPSTLLPSSGAPQIPGVTGQNAFQAVKQVAAGVKFGSLVTMKAVAKTDTVDNAKGLAGLIQLLANMAQLQASNDPRAATLLKGLAISSNDTVVNVTLSLPQDQFAQLLNSPKPATTTQPRRRVEKKM